MGLLGRRIGVGVASFRRVETRTGASARSSAQEPGDRGAWLA